VSEFRSTVQLNFVALMRGLSFRGCKFSHPPSFPRSQKIPQRTDFSRATFQRHAEDESAFRSIRNYFSDHRARDPEGRFYTLEKRCHRLGMTRLREWTPRAISYLYDLTSEYGYSYGWALFWFVAVQVLFGLTYAGLSDRLFHPGGRFDSRVVALTFAQVVKPFELFSAKAPIAGAYAILPDGASGWWVFLTATQSVLSITLIALFLLAIRWRFRKGVSDFRALLRHATIRTNFCHRFSPRILSSRPSSLSVSFQATVRRASTSISASPSISAMPLSNSSTVSAD